LSRAQRQSRSSLERMGGGNHFPYPKNVWSPSGGWWHDPPHWRRNTMVLVAGLGVVAALLFNKSRSLENWHGKTPVVSWTWNTNPNSEHRKTED